MRASRRPPKTRGARSSKLKAAGCGKIFREKITGTTADRPQLAKLMKALAAGDVVISPAVDRLSRDTADLLVIARDMQHLGGSETLQRA
jgi:DNA invertase Pin-like site-specific DNA recombinase